MPVVAPVQMPIVAENKFSSAFAKLRKDLKASKGQVAGFNKALVQNSAIMAKKGQDFKKFGGTMTSFGKGLTMSVTAPILAIGAASVKAAADLEKGMQNVASLGVGSERIKELTVDVSRMTETFGKSTTDITDGLYQVISAFGDTSESAKILEINAMGAAAGLATTDQAIALTSAVTKAYGDTSAAAVQQVTDLAFQTVKLGQTTFPELAASIGQVTPLTKELGISQENLFGVMATATGVTGSAAEVSTQFKGVLSGLMSPTKTMTALYKKMGVEGGAQLIKKQGGIAETMKLIVDASKKSKIPLKDFIGSIRGQTIALAMAGPQYDTLISKTKAMSNAQGAAAGAFAQQQKSFSFQLAQFRELLVNAGTEIGTIVIPVLIDLMKTVKPVIQSFKNASPEMKKTIVVLAGVAAAIGPVVIFAGSLVTAVGGLMSVFSAITPVLTFAVSAFSQIGTVIAALPALLNPVTVVIGGLTAGFAAGLYVFEKFFTNIQNSKTAPKWIKNFASDWLNGLAVMKDGFSDFGKFISETFDKVWKLAMKGLNLFVGQYVRSFETIASAIPDWVKESVGIDINNNGDGNNTTTSEEISQIQAERFMTTTNIMKQQQDVNLNIGNAPQGSTVETKGDDIAMLNLGFVQ